MVSQHIQYLNRGVVALASLALFAPCAVAQVDPSGIDFVTIGAVNNPAYAGPDNNFAVTGRGSVSYEYRIGRTEVTTSQWLEFYNLFYGRVPHVTLPARWGASDRGAGASPRFVLSNAPDAGLFPVSGASWRAAAMFCNRVHNDKSSDLSAVKNGAYDISTFGYAPGTNVFTDQHTRHPDAKYWIPSVDEWIKAGFYDPNYGGQGVGGWWWNTPAATNVPLVHGPPGQGQANTGFDLPGGGHYRIPLGAYPDVQSPWGLLDMAGATREFTETVRTSGGVKYRTLAGTNWTGGVVGIDAIYMLGSEFPSSPSLFHGLRVAAAVPSPGTTLFCSVCASFVFIRQRRR
jgi:sulfatase modifying factor 1